MNSKAFFDKVREMRAAQREYFKTRSADALSRSKQLEKEIDAEIKRVERLTKPCDPNLFDIIW